MEVLEMGFNIKIPFPFIQDHHIPCQNHPTLYSEVSPYSSSPSILKQLCHLMASCVLGLFSIDASFPFCAFLTIVQGTYSVGWILASSSVDWTISRMTTSCTTSYFPLEVQAFFLTSFFSLHWCHTLLHFFQKRGFHSYSTACWILSPFGPLTIILSLSSIMMSTSISTLA